MKLLLTSFRSPSFPFRYATSRAFPITSRHQTYRAIVESAEPGEIQLLEDQDQCASCIQLSAEGWTGRAGNRDFCGCLAIASSKCLQCILRNRSCSFVIDKPTTPARQSPKKKVAATAEDIQRVEQTLAQITRQMEFLGKEVRGGLPEGSRKRAHRE